MPAPHKNWAVDDDGDIVAGAEITVRDAAGNLATIYSDNGSTSLSNPFNAGDDGGYEFYAATGVYTVYTGTAPTQSSRPIVIVDVGTPFQPFRTRAAFASALQAGLSAPDGTVVSIEDLSWRFSSGATAISDMPGVLPVAPVDTKHFGAVGDGSTAAAVETASVQDAVEYCEAAGIGTLKISAGTFNLNEVVVTGNVYIEGYMSESVFDCKSSDGPAFSFASKWSGMIGCRLIGNGTAYAGIQWEIDAASNGRRLLHRTRIENFQYGVINEGAGGIEMDGIEVSGCSVTQFLSKGNFMESVLSKSTLWGFGTSDSPGGDALEIRHDAGLTAAEGYAIQKCTLLATGGSPLILKAALSVRFENNTISEGLNPILIDTSGGGAVTSVTFSGNYFFSGKPGAVGTILIKGPAASRLRFYGGEINHRDGMYGVKIDGPGPQRIVFDGVAFSASGETGATSGTIGIHNLGGKVMRVINCDFANYSGDAKCVLEDDNCTSFFVGNNFEKPVPREDISEDSYIPVNYGAGSGSTNGNFSLWLPDGAVDDPALAWQGNPDAGLYRVGTDGMGYAVNGALSARFDPDGILIPSDKALRGEVHVISNDAVYSFTPEKPAGFVRVIVDQGACEFSYRATASPRCVIATANAQDIFNGGTGVLSGTSGPDEEITVTAHTDGKIYVENRLGTSKNFSILVGT